MLKLMGWGVIFAFAALYALALALYAGDLLGLTARPASGAFLVPMGSPWNRIVDMPPDERAPFFAAVAPAVNLVLLYLLCRPRTKSRRA